MESLQRKYQNLLGFSKTVKIFTSFKQKVKKKIVNLLQESAILSSS